MTLIIDLIALLLIGLVMPFVFVAVFLANLIQDVLRFFYVPLLIPAIGAAGLACLTWINSELSTSLPYVSLIQYVSQSQIFGMSVPFALGALAFALFTAAGLKGVAGVMK